MDMHISPIRPLGLAALILVLMAAACDSKSKNAPRSATTPATAAAPEKAIVGRYRAEVGEVSETNQFWSILELDVHEDGSLDYTHTSPTLGEPGKRTTSKAKGRWTLAENTFTLKLEGSDEELKEIPAGERNQEMQVLEGAQKLKLPTGSTYLRQK